MYMYHAIIEVCLLGEQTANKYSFLQGVQPWHMAQPVEGWMGFNSHTFPARHLGAIHTVYGAHSLLLSSPVVLGHEEITTYLSGHIQFHTKP